MPRKAERLRFRRISARIFTYRCNIDALVLDMRDPRKYGPVDFQLHKTTLEKAIIQLQHSSEFLLSAEKMVQEIRKLQSKLYSGNKPEEGYLPTQDEK